MESLGTSSTAEVAPSAPSFETSGESLSTWESNSISMYGDNSKFFESTGTAGFKSGITSLLNREENGPGSFEDLRREMDVSGPAFDALRKEMDESGPEFDALRKQMDESGPEFDALREELATSFDRDDYPWLDSTDNLFEMGFNRQFESLMDGNSLFSSDLSADSIEQAFNQLAAEWNEVYNPSAEDYNALEDSGSLIGQIGEALLTILSDKQVQKYLVKLFFIVTKFVLTGGVIPTNPLELIGLIAEDIVEDGVVGSAEELGVAVTQGLTTTLVEQVVENQFDLSDSQAALVGALWELFAYGPDDEGHKNLNAQDVRQFTRNDMRTHLRNVPRSMAA